MQKKPGEGQHWDTARQKAWLRELFDREEWLFGRLLDGMDATEDFYFEVLHQLKMDRWSNGRVILIGDAA
ncbi:hypothetical protein ACNFJ7_01080 [Sphingomonas sp. HT-1]|uniref:hypothetical protein n=1 Tax=unclassified Sphingomonas TaxID=196159 RepID=UPI00156AD070|nr:MULTISPECIES: hypothetical protein [unclassified Sphingomonas]